MRRLACRPDTRSVLLSWVSECYRVEYQMTGLVRKLLAAVVVAALAPAPAVADGVAVRLEIKGAIGPATSAYLQKGIEHADEIDADLVVVEMDTPGGLDSAMRDMIKAILNSDVPVVTYVSPSGSRCVSQSLSARS